ncbi:R3H and coiled-coil domain-containing protein 1 [Denticeps clupeoides]|uniref:R3H and coiled-coil domain-containing protein 1 n=1 Tax=Denticeps clupeoides TaxID=299321 RepID=UPI0010A45705|nr:R3H and coiled-coil domain-containing protein 1 [Denticeps clupeoides]
MAAARDKVSDGVFIPKEESEFIHTVLDELDAYHERNNEKSVLVFPPFPSRLRFLIHRTLEKTPDLATFSVGELWRRRVVVCYSHLRMPTEEESDTDGSSCEQQNHQRKSQTNSRRGFTAEPGHKRGRGARRPDKAIYVPRALKERDSHISALQHQSQSSFSVSRLSLSSSKETSLDTAEWSAIIQDPGVSHTEESQRGPEVFRQVSSTETEQWPPMPLLEQTVSYFVAMSMEDQTEEGASSSDGPASLPKQSASREWDGEDFTQEILANLIEVDVTIEHARNNYSTFENVWINYEDFAHVIEIYNFPAIFKTEDLVDAFAEFSEGGMKIKWVDNTHALGVFSCKTAASHALSIQHPLLNTRALSKGSKKAKAKAFRHSEFIQPVKERPRTDTAVARRMVTRALGMQRGGLRGKRS